MNHLQATLAGLTDADPRQRDIAAEHLADLLRYTTLAQGDTELAVRELVALLGVESDRDVRESALNALGEAITYHTLNLELFRPLEPMLASMSPRLLEHALYILSATHDPQARATIEAFLNHPDPAVRGYAADALVELAGRDSPS
ncbi:HEAT repeat domain-containing protein [Hamadaea sp. NPDC050747]|uniref:HEAT repeat domain-containing protein n=1 Tax=Hamadaea sp. NPDC050747 TaxID=3155789 RepID=UPI0033F589B4